MLDSLRGMVVGNFFISMAVAVSVLFLGTMLAVKSESRIGWVMMAFAVVFGFFVLKWTGVLSL